MTTHQLPTEEGYRERDRKRDELTLQLADDVRNLLIRLFQRAYVGQHSVLQALNNCMEWMPIALEANGVEYEHRPGKNKRSGSIVFELHGFACELYNFNLTGDTRNNREHPNSRGDSREYLGNLLKLRIYRIAEGLHQGKPELRMQWLAADITTSDGGMTRDQFDQWGWAFPKPIFCTVLGEHRGIRDWLMLAKDSLSN